MVGWKQSHPRAWQWNFFLVPSYSTKCPKSTDASWVCTTSSPWMNLSVIFMTYTHVISGHCPRANCTNASFKTGRVSPNASCRKNGQVSSLSGTPEVMTGQAIITDAPVSMVTRHDFPPIQPSTFRLSSPCLTDTLNVWWGGGSDDTSDLLVSSSIRFSGPNWPPPQQSFWGHRCWHSLLRWSMPPHCQDTSHPVLLYLVPNDHD
jgi:hypothetical protein